MRFAEYKLNKYVLIFVMCIYPGTLLTGDVKYDVTGGLVRVTQGREWPY